MYNRYIRNDNGVYDRVPQQETAPPSRPTPPPRPDAPPEPGRRRGQSSVRLSRRRRRSGSF